MCCWSHTLSNNDKLVVCQNIVLCFASQIPCLETFHRWCYPQHILLSLCLLDCLLERGKPHNAPSSCPKVSPVPVWKGRGAAANGVCYIHASAFLGKFKPLNKCEGFFYFCCRRATQFSEQDSETSTWKLKSQSEEMLQALGTFSSMDAFTMEGENTAQMFHLTAAIGKRKSEKLLSWFKKILPSS